MILGFTVGCFDLLHHGHINLLRQAREHCDYLIVAVTTDHVTRLQKGHDRPRDSFPKRWNNVRKTGLADKLVVFRQFDVSDFLQVADVWILGDNQLNMLPTPGEWPGRKVFIPETPGVSTTQLMQDD